MDIPSINEYKNIIQKNVNDDMNSEYLELKIKFINCLKNSTTIEEVYFKQHPCVCYKVWEKLFDEFFKMGYVIDKCEKWRGNDDYDYFYSIIPRYKQEELLIYFDSPDIKSPKYKRQMSII